MSHPDIDSRAEAGGARERPAPRGRLARWSAVYRGHGLSRNVRALSWTSFFQDVASEMVYPLLPTFLLALGGSAAVLGAMESAAEAMLALVKGWAGRASDRRGRRKPFVVWGYGLSALTRPLMAAAAAAFHVVTLRIADRFAKGLRTAPRDALLVESTPPELRTFAFSFHRGLDHLGAAVGPLVAAALLVALASDSPSSFRWVFALATLPALAGCALAAFQVHEKGVHENGARVHDTRGPMRARVGPLPRRLRLPLAALLVFTLGSASDAFLLLLASRLGWTALGLTLLWSGFHVAKWLASAPSGRLADRLGPRLPLLAGWGLHAAAYCGFALAASGWVGRRSGGLLVAVLAVYALYYGLTEGSERALVVRLAGSALGAGSSLGAYHLVLGLGRFGASLLFGLVWELVSPATAFTLGAGLALLAAALMAAATRDGSS